MIKKSILKLSVMLFLLTMFVSITPFAMGQPPAGYFFTLNLVVPYGPGVEQDKASAVKDDLAEIGINVVIQTMESAEYYAQVWGEEGYNKTWDEGGWDMEIGRFSWRPAGAIWFEGCWSSIGLPPGGWNYFGWRNGIADRALKKGWTTIDPEERLEHYETFLWEFYRDPPAMSEYWPLMPRPLSTHFNLEKTAENYGMTMDELELAPDMFFYERSITVPFAPYWEIEGFAEGAEKTLVFAHGTDPPNILPLFHSSGNDFNYGMSEPLIIGPAYDTVNDRPGVIPWLAESWEWAEDGLALTFILRDDIYWQDDTPITAADVKWTIDTISDPDAAAAAHGDYSSLIESTEVINDTAVKLNLYDPAPDLLTVLSGPWEGSICPKHILEGVALADLKSHWMNAEGPTTDNPTYVGSGPFQLTEWVKGQSLTFEAWEDWWGWAEFGDGVPTVDKIIVEIQTDATTALADLEAGDIDGMHAYLCLPVVTEIPAVADRTEDVYIYNYAMLTIRFIGFNLHHPVLNNRNVRLAICHAHNNTRVIEDILLGLGVPATGPIPNTHGLYPDNPPPAWECDIELAKEHMEKAGYMFSYLEPAAPDLLLIAGPAVITLVVGIVVGFGISKVIRRGP